MLNPLPIEDKLAQSPYIARAMVVGQDQKFLAALIIPELEALEQLAIEKAITYLEKEELVSNPFIIELIQNEVHTLVSAKNGFKAFERIFRFKVLPKDFEVGVELTHSLKIRRNVVEKIYKNEIKELFR